MQTIKQILTAGQPWPLHVPAKFMQLVVAPATVSLKFYQGGKVVDEAEEVEEGFYCNTEGFDRVEVTSSANQLVKIILSDGSSGTSRIAGSVTASVKTANGIVNVPMKTVGTAEVLAAAANSNRLGLRFLNAGGSNIALGGAGLAFEDAAIVLAPGQLWIENDAPGAAWVAIGDMAGGTLKVQELTA